MFQVTRLRMARITRGMKQIELSRVTKIHPSKLSMLENGWREIKPIDAEKIAAALKISPKEILENSIEDAK